MKFQLIHLASADEAWIREAELLYQKKISPFIKFEIVHLSPKKAGRDLASEKVKAESEVILKYLEPTDFVILFDEKGKPHTSESFSKVLEKAMNTGKKRTTLIIGGAFGVSEEVRSRADQMVSLSNMIMNHLVAEVVVLEQLYRGFTILKNLPYHNRSKS